MKTYSVLLVDDSYQDRLLMRQTFRHHPTFSIIGELGDGVEAIAYLLGQEKFTDRRTFPFPDLLILDLEMPHKNGFEVLAWLQTCPFKYLVVTIMSGTALPEDRERCLALGAHAFYPKNPTTPGRDAIIHNLKTLLDTRHLDRA